MYITNKTITDLSVQELVDCSSNFDCYGGSPRKRLKRFLTNKNRICTDKSYPYEGVGDEECRARNGKFGTTCTGYVVLPGNEGALKKAMETIGLVSISFGVSRQFFTYKNGIYDGSCGTLMNHAILAVGYGTDNETRLYYWVVKNS